MTEKDLLTAIISSIRRKTKKESQNESPFKKATSYITNMLNELEQVHPRNIIYISDSTMCHALYKITYSYRTARGLKKTGEKILIIRDGHPEMNISQIFYNHMNDYNKMHPYRQLLNVQILNSRFLDSDVTRSN